MSEEKKMSFLDHLEELRWRLVKSAVAVLLFAVFIWIYQSWIMDTFFLSMSNKNFISFELLCKYLGVCVEDIPIKFQSTTMSGQFSYALMMSFMGGLVFAFPYLFYQVWSFVKPGLKMNELNIAKGIIVYVSLLFFTGILFGYFVIAPLAVQFFGAYQISDKISNDFTISSFMSTVLSTIFYTGLMFLLPVVSYLFAKLGIITPMFLRKFRKHSIVGIFILAAIITPPDVISQIIVSIPIILLYEVGIVVAARVYKQKEKDSLK